MQFLRWLVFILCLLASAGSVANILEGPVEQPVWLSIVALISFLLGATGAILKNRYLVLAPGAYAVFRAIFVFATATNAAYGLGGLFGALLPCAFCIILSLGFSNKLKF